MPKRHDITSIMVRLPTDFVVEAVVDYVDRIDPSMRQWTAELIARERGAYAARRQRRRRRV